jgi:phosphoribosylformylglycinamidine (FGAM) synthase-like enzyme
VRVQAALAEVPSGEPLEQAYRNVLAMRTLPRALGGSVIADVLAIPAATLPEVDYEWFARACRFVREAVRRGLSTAVRDISDGGPLVAMTEMAFASVARGMPIGLRFYLDDRTGDLAELEPWRAPDRVWYFDESPGFVLEVPRHAHDDVSALLSSYGFLNSLARVWTVAEPVFEVFSDDDDLVESLTLDELREAWEAPLRGFYSAADAGQAVA